MEQLSQHHYKDFVLINVAIVQGSCVLLLLLFIYFLFLLNLTSLVMCLCPLIQTHIYYPVKYKKAFEAFFLYITTLHCLLVFIYIKHFIFFCVCMFANVREFCFSYLYICFCILLQELFMFLLCARSGRESEKEAVIWRISSSVFIIVIIFYNAFVIVICWCLSYLFVCYFICLDVCVYI